MGGWTEGRGGGGEADFGKTAVFTVTLNTVFVLIHNHPR